MLSSQSVVVVAGGHRHNCHSTTIGKAMAAAIAIWWHFFKIPRCHNCHLTTLGAKLSFFYSESYILFIQINKGLEYHFISSF